MVTLRFQQQRIHVGVAGNARCLGLNSLGAADFKAFGRSIGVQCHILGLERGWAETVLLEDTAKCSSNDALTHITASPCKHNGM